MSGAFEVHRRGLAKRPRVTGFPFQEVAQHGASRSNVVRSDARGARWRVAQSSIDLRWATSGGASGSQRRFVT